MRIKNSRKVLYIILLLITIILTLTGCAKCVSTETSTVQVKIVDKYYSSAYTTPVYYGKTWMMTTHPAVYRITVEYNDIQYNINGHSTYEKYSNRIGDSVNAVLQTKTYDDDSVKYEIIELE